MTILMLSTAKDESDDAAESARANGSISRASTDGFPGPQGHTDRFARAHPHAAALALSTHHAQCQLPNVIVIVTRNCSMIIS